MTWLVASPFAVGPLVVHDAADLFRLINVLLGVMCVAFMLLFRGSVWREQTVGRALAVAVAFMYLVWTYAELEIVWLDPVGRNDHDADNNDGARVYLTTLALLMTLAALLIRNYRARSRTGTGKR